MNIKQSLIISIISISLISSCVEFSKSNPNILNINEYNISEYSLEFTQKFNTKISDFHSNVDEYMENFFINSFIQLKKIFI
ncbi:hypothetical protein ACWNT8_09580 [Pigmentibacter ruber]|uniref:hypothetical protein n=1 Tax=Pigmentibacter ruber TaxID=2683196 RepID=UPI00131C3131|nr:hypothetical protein [Pigmentibacter ruber]BFD32460.1 hypothetical protein GTC16762_20780 [Pigmentibacter ruber]